MKQAGLLTRGLPEEVGVPLLVHVHDHEQDVICGASQLFDGKVYWIHGLISQKEELLERTVLRKNYTILQKLGQS
jgi:hypothetical protein